MFNAVLSNRSNNNGVIQNFKNQAKTTAFSGNSPFNLMIKDTYGSVRDPSPSYSYNAGHAFESSDGVFPNGLGTPYAGKGELWSLSGVNPVKSMYADTNNIKQEWVTAVAIDEGMKSKAQAEAALFLPTIFEKMRMFEESVAKGIPLDPKQIFTETELLYVKTLPLDKDVLKKMIDMVNKQRVEAKLPPMATPASLGGATTGDEEDGGGDIPDAGGDEGESKIPLTDDEKKKLAAEAARIAALGTQGKKKGKTKGKTKVKTKGKSQTSSSTSSSSSKIPPAPALGKQPFKQPSV